jgi:AcrR family transcriptional regulator
LQKMKNQTTSALTIEIPGRGRPRSEEIHQTILREALQQVLDIGFRAVSIESISAKAGVGKTTIYRRWPNKAAVVMDAFMQEIGPVIAYSATPKAAENIRLQMRALAKAFRGRFGSLIKAILGEAQFDPELAEAFRELRSGIEIDTAIDALYGGIYYRVQTGNGPLNDAYVDGLFQHVMQGLQKPAA